MPKLVWDRVGDRVYETGLDQGVLYLPDGSAVPWNGLTSVIEEFDRETSAVYYDGMKINDLITVGDFSATMKAVTYPDEFLKLEGLASDRLGLFYANQQPQSFGLCYRTRVGNDLEGDEAGYKIHILYNVTAIPSEKTYATTSAEPSLVEFEWSINAVPEEVPGFRPTSHIIIDSTNFDPWLLEELEEMLYGGTLSDAALIPMADLITYINEWYRVKIIDHGDGTWTAETRRDGFIQYKNAAKDLFEIIQVNAVYLDDVTFQISDTLDVTDVPQIKVVDNGDGTWTAVTEHPSLITVDEEGLFEIKNANATFLSPVLYRIESTID